jgi:hypothetical protein
MMIKNARDWIMMKRKPNRSLSHYPLLISKLKHKTMKRLILFFVLGAFFSSVGISQIKEISTSAAQITIIASGSIYYPDLHKHCMTQSTALLLCIFQMSRMAVLPEQ